MSRQVIVLGNHRTGSSCLSGVLSKLGISMGYQMLGAHSSNPGGHFEDKEFLLINDAVIGHWENPRVEYGLDEKRELRDTYASLVERRNFDFQFWGMKDPRLCILLPIILPLLDDPVILHIVRNYEASIKSVRKRESWGDEKAKAVLDIYTVAKASTLKIAELAGVPVKTVQFEELVADPQATIESFMTTIYAGTGAGERPSSFLVGLAAKHVNREYVHHE